jgi:hypothetical protein
MAPPSPRVRAEGPLREAKQGEEQWPTGPTAADGRSQNYSCDLIGRMNFSNSFSFIGRFCQVW